MFKTKVKEFLELFFTFAKIGSFTFGGGMAMMPMLQRELVEKKKWITEEELIDYYAIGQSTPGIIAVNVSTFAGYKKCGISGGVIATLGMVTPSVIIIMLLASLINSINDYPVVQKALSGINVAVAALLTHTIVNFSKKTIKNIWNFIFMAISFVLLYFFKVESFIIILSAILIGIIKTEFSLRKKSENSTNSEENQKNLEEKITKNQGDKN